MKIGLTLLDYLISGLQANVGLQPKTGLTSGMVLVRGRNLPLKDGESDAVEHNRHNAVPRMKIISRLVALADVERPVSHGVSLWMSLGSVVKQQKGHRLTSVQDFLVQLGRHHALCEHTHMTSAVG